MLRGKLSAFAFVAALFALAATASSVKAEFIITITADATGVTTSGAGSIDTTDLTLTPYGGGSGAIFFPSIPVVGVGTPDALSLEYTGLTTTISPFGIPVFPPIRLTRGMPSRSMDGAAAPSTCRPGMSRGAPFRVRRSTRATHSPTLA